MKDKKLLLDRLKEYADRGVLPMHMPGHKRNTVSYPWLKELGGAYDVTEIEGFDDLVEVDCRPGVRSFLSVNGSTGGILAAVRTAVRPGDLLLMGRNCHRSVYHAAEICGARVRYLMPDWDEEFGIFKLFMLDVGLMGFDFGRSVFKRVFARVCVSGKLSLFADKNLRNGQALGKGRGEQKSARLDGGDRVNFFVFIQFHHFVDAKFKRVGLCQNARYVVKKDSRLGKVGNAPYGLVQKFCVSHAQNHSANELSLQHKNALGRIRPSCACCRKLVLRLAPFRRSRLQNTQPERPSPYAF